MGSAALQGALWGADSQVWSQTLEQATRPLFERVLDEIGVGSGCRLLDVGCGAGLALQIGAERGASIAGLDAAEGMLAVARRRLPGADLHDGDLETLPFDEDWFDAVTAFNSVQYAADPTRALAEIRRVAVPGAPVALSTWAAADRCETRTVLAAIGSLLPRPRSGSASGGPFALSDPGRLEDLVRKGGLEPMRAGEVDCNFDFVDVEAAVRAHLSAGPARRAVEVVGRAATTEALREALTDSVEADGRSVQRNAFRYLIATAQPQ